MKLKAEYERLIGSYSSRHTSPEHKDKWTARAQEIKDKIPSLMDDMAYIEFKTSLVSETEGRRICEGLAKSVEKKLANSGTQINFSYYLGEYPLNEVNACVKPITEGYLVLLNSGLLIFLNKYAKLWSLLNVILRFDSTGGAYIPTKDFGSNRAKMVIPAINYSFEDIIDLILELILAYGLTGNPWEAKKVDLPIDEGVMMLRAVFLNSMEEFAVLHEFAHILDGHLSNGASRNLQTPKGQLPVFQENWQQEHAADWISLKVLIDSTTESRGDIRTEKDWIMFLVAIQGVIGLLGAFDLVESVIAKVLGKSRLSDTHPPALLRVQLLLERLQKNSDIDLVNSPNVRMYTTAFQLMRKSVLATLDDNYLTQK